MGELGLLSPLMIKRVLFLSLVLGQMIFAQKVPTAFEALKSAENHIAKESVGKLIQIVGERDATALTPSVWSFVFLDLTASQQGRLVTIRAGKPIEIRDGYFEKEKLRLAAYKADEVISPSLLKIDSHQALQAVIKSAGLEKVKLSTVTFRLNNDNGAKLPRWKLNLYADKEGKEADIGHAIVSAETGSIIESKINLDKLADKKKK